MAVIRLNGHHLFQLYLYKNGMYRDREPSVEEHGYSLEYLKQQRRFYNWLISHPELKVEIVAGQIDNLCRLCRKQSPRSHIEKTCDEKIKNRSFARHDKRAAKSYGVEMNKVYTMGELINKIKWQSTWASRLKRKLRMKYGINLSRKFKG